MRKGPCNLEIMTQRHRRTHDPRDVVPPSNCECAWPGPNLYIRFARPIDQMSSFPASASRTSSSGRSRTPTVKSRSLTLPQAGQNERCGSKRSGLAVQCPSPLWCTTNPAHEIPTLLLGSSTLATRRTLKLTLLLRPSTPSLSFSLSLLARPVVRAASPRYDRRLADDGYRSDTDHLGQVGDTRTATRDPPIVRHRQSVRLRQAPNTRLSRVSPSYVGGNCRLLSYSSHAELTSSQSP